MQSFGLIKAYPVCAQFSGASVAESGNSWPEVMAPGVGPVLPPDGTKQSSVVTEAASVPTVPTPSLCPPHPGGFCGCLIPCPWIQGGPGLPRSTVATDCVFHLPVLPFPTRDHATPAAGQAGWDRQERLRLPVPHPRPH